MSRSHRFVSFLLATAVAVGFTAAPAGAAKQEIGPKVKVQGDALPSVDEDTFATSADAAVGKVPPTLVGEGFSGQQVTVGPSTLPRVVIFVAHWCPHCQAEVPVIVDLAKDGGFDGVQVDTIATSTSEDYPNYPPSKWLKREKWPFKPVLLDDKKSRALLGFGGLNFPYFVFVNADGTIAARTSGEIEPETLQAIVERLVAGKSLFSD